MAGVSFEEMQKRKQEASDRANPGDVFRAKAAKKNKAAVSAAKIKAKKSGSPAAVSSGGKASGGGVSTAGGISAATGAVAIATEDTGETSTGAGVAQGAAAGASVGAVGGPWGAAIGAVVGGIVGGVKAGANKKKAARQAKAAAEVGKQEALSRIAGSKGDRIQNALGQMSSSFSRTLGNNQNVRL